jgi:hypothetical protein
MVAILSASLVPFDLLCLEIVDWELFRKLWICHAGRRLTDQAFLLARFTGFQAGWRLYQGSYANQTERIGSDSDIVQADRSKVVLLQDFPLQVLFVVSVPAERRKTRILQSW